MTVSGSLQQENNRYLFSKRLMSQKPGHHQKHRQAFTGASEPCAANPLPQNIPVKYDDHCVHKHDQIHVPDQTQIRRPKPLSAVYFLLGLDTTLLAPPRQVLPSPNFHRQFALCMIARPERYRSRRWLEPPEGGHGPTPSNAVGTSLGSRV